MVALEFEGFLSTVVDTFLVREEVSCDLHLSDDWSILQNFTLYSIDFLSETKVDHFVDGVLLTAFIFKNVILGTSLILRIFFSIAVLSNKALTLAPRENMIH